MAERGRGLSGLFAPERIAVVGATEREGSVGRAVTANLLAGFEGEVVPVNPGRDSVLGVRCVASVADADADLAVIAVPSSAVADVHRGDRGGRRARRRRAHGRVRRDRVRGRDAHTVEVMRDLLADHVDTERLLGGDEE